MNAIVDTFHTIQSYFKDHFVVCLQLVRYKSTYSRLFKKGSFTDESQFFRIFFFENFLLLNAMRLFYTHL